MSENAAALRRSLEHAVKIDQSMLRYVLDQGRDCIKILGPDTRIEYINSEGRCALGINDFSKVCGRPWPEIWPEDSRPIIDAALAKAQSGESSEIEAWRPDSNNNAIWWRVSVSPLLEGNGDLAGILIISRDITEHVQLREVQQTLVLEMRHRLRNAYTIASAIVMQSARSEDGVQDFAEAVCARLANVALSQTRLLEAAEKSWTVAELFGTLVAAHGAGASGIRYAGDADAKVDGHEAMLLALVIGELTNNSLKYGALRDDTSVHLSWTDDGTGLAFHWCEPIGGRGRTGSLEPRNPGSGYAMMQRMARSQRASFEHQIADDLLSVKLKLAGHPAG